MYKPVIFIMSGMSFAGKTTLAAQLSNKLNIPVIDPDKVSNEMGLGLNGEFIPEEIWRQIHAESEKRVKKLLKEGKSLIYDTTALNKIQRDNLRKLAISAKAKPIVIVINISRDEAYRRWADNNRTQARFRVHIDDFNMCADGFEFPGEGEEYLVFNFGEDMDTWITKNFG